MATMRIRSPWPGTLARSLVLLLFTGIQVFPLFWMFGFSLKDNVQIALKGVFALPDPVRWENYGVIFSQLKIATYFRNSAVVASLTIVLTVLLSTMASYALVRMRWRLQKPTLTLFLTGIMISPHIALLPIFFSISRLGLTNSYASLVIPYVAFGLPTAIFILSAFYRVIPKELEEAACIDGSGIFRTFFHIILPVMKTPIATVAIFSFLNSWNELMFSLTFISKATLKTLPVAAMSFQGEYTIDWAIIAAAMVVATVPTLIIYFFLSEQVQSSLVAGAVKG